MKILLLLLLSFTVSAENYVHLGMWSQHSESGLNETHNLVGIEINGYFIHQFENSMSDTAYYAGIIERDGYCLDKLCLGYSYGVLKGYSFKELTPIAFAVLSFENNGVGFDLSCLPGTVCALQLRFSDKAFNYLNINPPWQTKGYLELSLDSFDPDGEGKFGFSRNNGVAYDAKIYLTDNIFLKGSYTTTDSTVAPDQGDEKFQATWITQNPSQIDSRGSIQIGKDYKNLSIGLSYNQISIQENIINLNNRELLSLPETHHRGFGVHISKDYQFTENLSFYAEAAIVDDLITDLRLTVETRYKITDALEITLRTIDYERWNMSQYQLGLRYNL